MQQMRLTRNNATINHNKQNIIDYSRYNRRSLLRFAVSQHWYKKQLMPSTSADSVLPREKKSSYCLATDVLKLTVFKAVYNKKIFSHRRRKHWHKIFVIPIDDELYWPWSSPGSQPPDRVAQEAGLRPCSSYSVGAAREQLIIKLAEVWYRLCTRVPNIRVTPGSSNCDLDWQYR